MFAILAEKELNDIRGMRLMPESWVIVRAPWECVSMVCCQHCRLGRTQNPWTDHTQAAKFDVGSASQRARIRIAYVIGDTSAPTKSVRFESRIPQNMTVIYRE